MNNDVELTEEWKRLDIALDKLEIRQFMKCKSARSPTQHHHLHLKIEEIIRTKNVGKQPTSEEARTSGEQQPGPPETLQIIGHCLERRIEL